MGDRALSVIRVDLERPDVPLDPAKLASEPRDFAPVLEGFRRPALADFFRYGLYLSRSLLGQEQPACPGVGALPGNDDRAPHSQVERANEVVGADRGCRRAPGLPAEEVEVDVGPFDRERVRHEVLVVDRDRRARRDLEAVRAERSAVHRERARERRGLVRSAAASAA